MGMNHVDDGAQYQQLMARALRINIGGPDVAYQLNK